MLLSNIPRIKTGGQIKFQVSVQQSFLQVYPWELLSRKVKKSYQGQEVSARLRGPKKGQEVQERSNSLL